MKTYHVFLDMKLHPDQVKEMHESLLITASSVEEAIKSVHAKIILPPTHYRITSVADGLDTKYYKDDTKSMKETFS